MLKKIWIMLLSCLVVANTIVLAQTSEESVATLVLKDATNREVKNILMQIVITNKDKDEERTISTFLDDNTLSLKMEEGNYELKLLADDLETPGKDYYASRTLSLKANVRAEVTLLPVGSIQGVVMDNLDNLVRNAALKITCDKEYGLRLPATTDKYGSFTGSYLPVGECQITATFGAGIGSTKVSIKQGESEDVVIKLDRSAIGQKSNITGNIILGIFLLILLGVTGIVIARKLSRTKTALQKELEKKLKKGRKKELAKKKREISKRSKRQEDLLNTLNEREKKIVEYLLANKNHSTQAKIRHAVGIPKTSLVRIFTALERKKIISIEKIGKLKKVKLTDWFLEKE